MAGEILGGVDVTRDDVMRETVSHVRRVAELMLDAVSELQRRAIRHDASKFGAEEFEAFAAETPNLRALTYNSAEYHEATARLGPALKHHYEFNSHHPQFYANGIRGMDLIDLIEMLADWRAATERHADGSIVASINQNAERFGYDEHMKDLLMRTARNLGWIKD